MKKSKFTEQQIAFASAGERWEERRGGMPQNGQRQLEEENARLRKVVADLTLDA
jgi:hypothetical protein